MIRKNWRASDRCKFSFSAGWRWIWTEWYAQVYLYTGWPVQTTKRSPLLRLLSITSKPPAGVKFRRLHLRLFLITHRLTGDKLDVVIVLLARPAYIDIIYQRLPKIFKTSNADCRRVPENHLCLLRMMQYLHVLSLYTYVRSGAWGMIYSHIKKKVYGNFGYWVRKFSNRELKRLRSKVKIIGCSPVRGLETGKLQHTYAINRSLDLSLWTHEAAT